MDQAGFEQIAERITSGLLEGKYDTYRSAFLLPLRVEPRGGVPYVLADDDALRKDWQLYRDAILIQGVTDIVREVLGIAEIEPDRIEVTVETNMLRHAQRIVDPFKTQFVLQPEGAEWRIAILRSSLGHINWTLGRADIVDDRFHDR
ncbi:hypothetical protein [Lacimonas salitolerans]|uniref:SnoaL-like domain-containing protein n=1 Tax=Lacimonas salitolerans TaxID=1323750 RepID=A0ABW4E9A6_9RHOB